MNIVYSIYGCACSGWNLNTLTVGTCTYSMIILTSYLAIYADIKGKMALKAIINNGVQAEGCVQHDRRHTFVWVPDYEYTYVQV